MTTDVTRVSGRSSFWWGAATAAYQVEGAVDEDGRGTSIWDTFCAEPGRIADGSSGAVACDSYHRWREDLDLLQGVGATAYRFSVAWPRIQPSGSGPVNQAGLDYYDRLVDGLLERGIAPFVTLFHWDLPQALQDDGGWTSRDTAHRFAAYATVVAEALGDRVACWGTLNEPFVHMALGHAFGTHAPGQTLLMEAFPVGHHQLLAHGLAAQALRTASSAPVMLVDNLTPVRAASSSEADLAATAVYDALHNRMFLDPVLRGRYPEALTALAEPVVQEGDLATIAQPLDLLGVNYYNPTVVQAPGADNPLPFELVPLTGVSTTGFGWPVVPEGLTELLVGLRDTYDEALPPVVVTENGCSYPDEPGPDGTIDDPDRIAYLDSHIRAVGTAREAGVDVRGYLTWSLLDNFEWADGYQQRFGVTYVDFATGERTPKASYAWLRDRIAQGW
ncbi:GH1 family beta-glucosidase [Mumia zhuanghuii]|uniref:Beta-glucosidase n=1 Tax=Mumia zhuanghuii TaxID=2585211 RepID=A0A5C4MMR9_9ACTN|nr:GH1 family beta-glucosidase [Mumia zhuanghuii]TNC46839.1 beta-glucosidase [Mumia zhuanghuii]TNC47113.1 beta-glucosidase [Mumia zhuanghuii]